MLLFSQIALLASLALASPGHHNHKSGRPARCDFEARNLETISSIYNLTTFPNNLAVVVGGEDAVPDGLFNDDVVGRVDPVGQFDGITDSIEYFFTLASPNKDGGVGITSFEITSYTSGCPGVAASTVFLYTSIIDADGKDTGVESLPIKQFAFWEFDDDGAVLRYDAYLPHLNRWVVETNGFDLTNAEVLAGIISNTCATTQEQCTGDNAVWDSFDECFEALSALEFGNYDETMGDNVVCRTIHALLTPFRPEIHCEHVGPTGGDKCVETPLLTYFNDEDLFGDELGSTFTC